MSKERQSKFRRAKLLALAKEFRERAAQLPFGPEREVLLKKARLTETAASLDDWANSHGLKPPS